MLLPEVGEWRAESKESELGKTKRKDFEGERQKV